MKLIIDIPEEKYEWIKKNNPNADTNSIVGTIVNGIPYEERPKGDLISREVLLKKVDDERKYLLARGQTGAEHILVHHCLPLIDNAPTVTDRTEEVLSLQSTIAKLIEGITENARPQGEWLDRNSGCIQWIRCSICNKHQNYREKTNFCPNCGADMRGMNYA